MKFEIRPLTADDWPRVGAIYKEGIDTRLATFRAGIPSYEDWETGHHPFCRLAACDEAGQLIGWTALSPAYQRDFYSGVAESSVYVAAEASGQGVGKALTTELVRQSEHNGIWTLEARIIKENKASVALHQACGFRTVGVRERFGQMPDGRWHDVVWMERRSLLAGK